MLQSHQNLGRTTKALYYTLVLLFVATGCQEAANTTTAPKEDPATAIRNFSTDSTIITTPTEGLDRRAVEFNKTGLKQLTVSFEFAKAIKNFSKAIEIEPTVATFYDNRGGAKYKLGQFSDSLADFKKAIELDPDSAPAHSNRAMVWIATKDYPAAIADCEKAIELDPRRAEPYYNKGNALMNSGSPGPAIQWFTDALKRKPNYQSALYMRGWAKQDLGCLLYTSPSPRD